MLSTVGVGAQVHFDRPTTEHPLLRLRHSESRWPAQREGVLHSISTIFATSIFYSFPLLTMLQDNFITMVMYFIIFYLYMYSCSAVAIFIDYPLRTHGTPPDCHNTPTVRSSMIPSHRKVFVDSWEALGNCGLFFFYIKVQVSRISGQRSAKLGA